MILPLAPQVNTVAKDRAEPESLSALNSHSVGEDTACDKTFWLDAEKHNYLVMAWCQPVLGQSW